MIIMAKKKINILITGCGAPGIPGTVFQSSSSQISMIFLLISMENCSIEMKQKFPYLIVDSC